MTAGMPPASARSSMWYFPDGLTLAQIVPVAVVAGIGFTVSLFVAELSFAGPLLEDAKVGVLVASLVAAVAGTVAIAARRTIRE